MKKYLCILLAVLLVAASIVTLVACDKEGNEEVILIWGPAEHESIYLKYAEQFKAAHEDAFKGYKFQYEGSGDAGAYSAMNVDPQRGAAVYTFANDQTANLRNLRALAVLNEQQLKWSRDNNSATAVESTKLGDEYVAYPLQADNGYFMYYNKDAFKGTQVWDNTKGTLKEGYTFRDLYAALDERAAQTGGEMWAKGKVTWAMGDSWYMSGIFFSVGGDYEVIYDSKGAQVGADCWFGYTLPEGKTGWQNGDYTVGYDAFQAAKNTITVSNTDNTVNKHFAYTDGDKQGLNDYIDLHTNPDNDAYKEAPLAAAVCGTWKASQLQKAWGDNYAATVLPTLETDDGERFQMKNFAGYKNLGVNPLCSYVSDGKDYADKQARLALLHEFAQFLCGKDISLERHTATGAGPANKEALTDPSVVADLALIALNAQYDLVCKYPSNYSKADLAGKLVGDGKGYRNQDSVPANYWTPIQEYGQLMYTEFSSGKLSAFSTQAAIKDKLADLQSQIAKAAQ